LAQSRDAGLEQAAADIAGLFGPPLAVIDTGTGGLNVNWSSSSPSGCYPGELRGICDSRVGPAGLTGCASAAGPMISEC
jgi:hypothetical protein